VLADLVYEVSGALRERWLTPCTRYAASWRCWLVSLTRFQLRLATFPWGMWRADCPAWL